MASCHRGLLGFLSLLHILHHTKNISKIKYIQDGGVSQAGLWTQGRGVVRRVPRSGSGKRRKQVRLSAGDRQQGVLGMGIRKRRGRGWNTGAEDGEVWPDMVRSDAGNGGVVHRREYGHIWRG